MIFSKLPNLTTVDVKYDLIRTCQSGKSKMKRYKLDRIKYLGKALQATKYICSLTISNSQLDDDMLRLLVEAMTHDSNGGDNIRNSLVYLDFSHNKISTDGLHVILNFFFENESVRNLSSDYSHERNKRSPGPLSIMNLENNLIEAEGGRAFGRILRFNTSLTSINLSLNRIGDKGCQMLLDGLRDNSTLKALYVSSISLSDDGIQSFLDLSTRSSDVHKDKSQKKSKCALETLDLSCNEISEVTIGKFASVSATDDIRTLDLRHQKIVQRPDMYTKLKGG